MTSISRPKMAMAEVLPHKIEAYLKQMRARWAEARRRRAIYRRTYAELAVLSDRELKDIGIGRGEIRSLAYETAGMEQKHD